MKLFQKIYIYSLACFVSFFVVFSTTSAFLGEDLGLDIYKKIDAGIYSLELKQYEYEMTGQGETSIGEVVNKELEEYAVVCDIESIDDIEKIISGKNQLQEIFERCNKGGKVLGIGTAKIILSEISSLRNSKKNDAVQKSKDIYDISRIGLYSDGISENSPFDIIVDIQEIDKVIFGEITKYNGEEWKGDGDTLLDDFLKEDKGYLYDGEDKNPRDTTNSTGSTTQTPEIPQTPKTTTGSTTPEVPDTSHNYICLDPLGESGLGSGSLDDLDGIINLGDFVSPSTSTGIIITRDTSPLGEDEYTNAASWGGPFRTEGPSSPYSEAKDDWNCRDEFFCIVIEFPIKTQDLLGGGESLSIKKVLVKAGEHIKKFANTSLVQGKMTTNNFESNLIIPNLGDMLRGLGIQVQTKPAPILNNIEKSDTKEQALKGDTFTSENMLYGYYKNIGQDYARRNDLDIYRDKTYEKKVFGESTGLPVTFPPARLRELEGFQESLAERNRVFSIAVTEKSVSEDQSDFYDQFIELERFVGSIEDFCTSMVGIIKKMKQIPTRSS